MLFNSAVFIFAFLPVTLLGYGLLTRWGPRRAAIAWLVGASLLYYGWWRPPYLALIAASIVVNYGVGCWLATLTGAPRRRRAVLAFGVGLNLVVLGYFKYALLAARTFETLTGADLAFEGVVLPLAISFFTFQQIAYLIDTARGLVRGRGFLDYCLFVTFFPQLIAGPIVHHGEMMPQFTRRRSYRLNSADLSVGLTFFTIGLAKKVLIADTMARFATPIFDAAHAGGSVTFLEAWMAALAYGFQIYFDFSGYSDMAIGLGRCFGIRLPLNFFSPYKATSISEFWRRWHITLSRFLRDYLYIPLGGNRLGGRRRYVNLLLTMLLGGLWHGANWVFVVWGGLHGVYLMVNHAWRSWRYGDRRADRRDDSGGWRGGLGRLAGGALTFLAVTVAWVFFRAGGYEDGAFATAWRVVGAMVGAEGWAFTTRIDIKNAEVWWLLTVGLVWLAPNTSQFMGQARPALGYARMAGPLRAQWQWRPGVITAAATVVLLLYTVWQAVSQSSEFIYYQF